MPVRTPTRVGVDPKVGEGRLGSSTTMGITGLR